jgi:hypothetical protein
MRWTRWPMNARERQAEEHRCPDLTESLAAALANLSSNVCLQMLSKCRFSRRKPQVCRAIDRQEPPAA